MEKEVTPQRRALVLAGGGARGAYEAGVLSYVFEHVYSFRAVYVLRDVEGMSTQETADSLALEVNTVKTRLHRARSMLRDRLYRNIDGAALDAFPFGAGRCDRLVATVLQRLERGGS